MSPPLSPAEIAVYAALARLKAAQPCPNFESLPGHTDHWRCEIGDAFTLYRCNGEAGKLAKELMKYGQITSLNQLSESGEEGATVWYVQTLQNNFKRVVGSLAVLDSQLPRQPSDFITSIATDVLVDALRRSFEARNLMVVRKNTTTQSAIPTGPTVTAYRVENFVLTESRDPEAPGLADTVLFTRCAASTGNTKRGYRPCGALLAVGNAGANGAEPVNCPRDYLHLKN
ncbi:hypothetical protein HMN09_00189800 [Mycena chlorophos]|uniref:Uncharacterized protein n=1 Tax=Mycena chlorophos TaxID=658473 RepID=A0A8H6TQM5_MYCCL|nr:hypothetical protein HMN09_00189800 [Mycena chlorophos]